MAQIDLHNMMFKVLDNSDSGEVDGGTIFHYRQEGSIIWATYKGGSVIFGTLSGFRENDTLHFTYQHRNTEGQFKMGKCTSQIEINEDAVQLHESWQWSGDNGTKGTSILQEL